MNPYGYPHGDQQLPVHLSPPQQMVPAVARSTMAAFPPPVIVQHGTAVAVDERKPLPFQPHLRGYQFVRLEKGGSWDRALRTELELSQTDLASICKRSSDKKGHSTAVRELTTLSEHKRGLINRLLRELKACEHQAGAEWNLVHLKVEKKVKPKHKPESSLIQVVVRHDAIDKQDSQTASKKKDNKLEKVDRDVKPEKKEPKKKEPPLLPAGAKLIDLNEEPSPTKVASNGPQSAQQEVDRIPGPMPLRPAFNPNLVPWTTTQQPHPSPATTLPEPAWKPLGFPGPQGTRPNEPRQPPPPPMAQPSPISPMPPPRHASGPGPGPFPQAPRASTPPRQPPHQQKAHPPAGSPLSPPALHAVPRGMFSPTGPSHPLRPPPMRRRHTSVEPQDSCSSASSDCGADSLWSDGEESYATGYSSVPSRRTRRPAHAERKDNPRGSGRRGSPSRNSGGANGSTVSQSSRTAQQGRYPAGGEPLPILTTDYIADARREFFERDDEERRRELVREAYAAGQRDAVARPGSRH